MIAKSNDIKECPCKQKKNKGWTEPEKNSEGKSKRHAEVADRATIKGNLQDTLRTPMRMAPEPEHKTEPVIKKAPFRIRDFFAKKPEEQEDVENIENLEAEGTEDSVDEPEE